MGAFLWHVNDTSIKKFWGKKKYFSLLVENEAVNVPNLLTRRWSAWHTRSPSPECVTCPSLAVLPPWLLPRGWNTLRRNLSTLWMPRPCSWMWYPWCLLCEFVAKIPSPPSYPSQSPVLCRVVKKKNASSIVDYPSPCRPQRKFTDLSSCIICFLLPHPHHSFFEKKLLWLKSKRDT